MDEHYNSSRAREGRLEKLVSPRGTAGVSSMQIQDAADPSSAVIKNLNNELIRPSKEFEKNQSSS